MFHVRFNNMENAEKFVDLALKFKSDISIKAGSYVVDGKSIMGILSLNLLDILEIDMLEKQSGEANEFFNKIKELGIVV